MLKTPTTVSSAIFFAVLLGIVTSGAAAPPEGKGGGKDKGSASPVISVEWRRDVWQAPEIRTIDENGDNMSTVTKDLRRAGWPRWSPDGQRLGGYYKALENGDSGLMSIAPDGTDEQVILLSSKYIQFNIDRGFPGAYSSRRLAAWSPDGRFMVFSGRVAHPKSLFVPQPAYDLLVWRLFIVDTGDGAITTVTDVAHADDLVGTDPALDNYYDYDPHWSWTLDKVVFVRSAVVGGMWTQELWTVNPDGTELQQLTAFGYVELYEPGWSHSGDFIAVGVDPGYESSDPDFPWVEDIWLLDVRPFFEVGGTDQYYPITSWAVVRDDPSKVEGAPTWSPNDEQLVFTRMGAANSRTRRFEILTVDLDTDSETVLLESNKQAILWPDWNPVPPAP